MQKLSIKLLILGSVLSGPSSYAQNQQIDKVGLQELYKQTSQSINKEIKEAILEPPKNAKIKQVLRADDQVELTARQFSAILLNATDYQKEIFSISPCSLYTFLANEIFTIDNKKLALVEVEVMTDGKKEVALVPTSIFLKQYYKSRCRLSFKQARLFEKGRVKDNIQKLTPEFPLNENQCLDQFKFFKENINIDHICSIPYTIQLSNRLTPLLSKEVSASQRTYINKLRKKQSYYETTIESKDILYYQNICSNLSRSDKFCKNYAKQDFWSLIINKQKPNNYIHQRCLHIMNKEVLKSEDYLRCIGEMRRTPEVCSYAGLKTSSVLYPMPDCNETSEALKESRLKNNFNDCPRRISNLSIVNGARLIKHFSKDSKLKNEKDCVFPSFASIFELYEVTKETSKWPLQICYKKRDKKECSAFIPGNSQDNFNALNMVIANELYQSKIVNNRIKCDLIEKTKFNPLRLKFKTGCWVKPKKQDCKSDKCKYEVILNSRKVLDVWSEGSLSFDYFKTKYNSKDAAIHDRIIDTLRLKEQEINSLSSLKFFLKNKKDGLVHGVGCREDIYPELFQSQKLGVCSPVPFIIDGLHEINNNTYLSFRSGLDDVNTPRKLLWSNVFTAISRYSVSSPLKLWDLYGIY